MKKQTLKILSLVLAMLVALSACGGTANETAPPQDNTGANTEAPVQEPGGNDNPGSQPPAGAGGISEDAELKVAISAQPEMLLPLYQESKVSSSVNMCLYDTLVYWNVEKGEAEPRIAESWEWLEDENGDTTRLRFKLREDIFTPEGYQITAEDVLYSFECIGLGNNGALTGTFLDVAGFVVEDEFTIVLKTFMPYPTLLDRIGCDMYAIVSKQAVEARGGLDAVLRSPAGIGTGKYIFEEWVDDQYITIVRNDNYWDQDALPYYKRIRFSFISDTASRAMAVESGDVDIAAEIQSSQVPPLENNPDLNVEIYNMTTNRTFYMNCSKGPLAEPKVREAVFYLLNPEAVMAIANGGYGHLSETNFSTFSPYYAAPGADYQREVNIEKAKELLAEAGYPNGFELEFMTVATSQAVAEIVQENLRQGGITLNVNLLEIGTYLENLFGGNYDTYIGSADNWDAANLLRAFDGRQPTYAAIGGAQYVNDELAALIDKAYTEFDDSARRTAYAECQAFVRENFVCIGLCNEVRIECYAKDLGGLEFDMRGYAIYMNMSPTA